MQIMVVLQYFTYSILYSIYKLFYLIHHYNLRTMPIVIKLNNRFCSVEDIIF